MSESVLRLNHEVTSTPSVGADLLSTISDGLYGDAREVYREFVQNSADAYESRNAPVSQRVIEINVNRAKRSVHFRDFATGMNADDMASKLLSLGMSAKRLSPYRGFRGIGRMAALGYCKRLIFRSRQVKSSKTMELVWNCQLLHELLNRNEGMNIRTAIEEVTEFGPSASTDDDPDCFFDCILEGIKFTQNDALINPHMISEYLSETGPVPFNDAFCFRNEIDEIMQTIKPFTLRIHVNGSSEWLTKPHRNHILKLDGSISTKVQSVEEVSHTTSSSSIGRSIIHGWYLNHDFPGALPLASRVRGLRTRVGNMQVGDEASWSFLFQEPRFNLWHIAEIHVDSKTLSPNTRRNGFAYSPAFDDLTNELSTIAIKFAEICRIASQRRNSVQRSKQRSIALQNDVYLDILSQLKVDEPLPERLILTPINTITPIDTERNKTDETC